MKIVLRIVLCICILAVGVFAFLLFREYFTDGQGRAFYSDLADDVERRPTEPETAVTGDSGSVPSDGEDSPWQPYVDFDALDLMFPGIVGWIRLEGTSLDYPVMQYRNNDFFLSHLPDGSAHRNGSIFLDYRNDRDFSDKSILIFGHETANQDMFGVLKNYRQQEFFDENPIVYLHTPERDYTILLFAGHLAHSQRDHPPLHFADNAEFLDYIEHVKSISFFSSDVEVSPEDRIVSLCTCAYDFDDARLILVGILV